MTGTFATIELVVALVGAASAGGAFAVRVYSGPDPPTSAEVRSTLRRWAPGLVGWAALLALGTILEVRGRGDGFLVGVAAGGLAALAMLLLDGPDEPDGPGAVERAAPLHRAVAGIGSTGVAILAVLGVLLRAGSAPTALLAIPVGAGVLLLLGEARNPRDGRLRFVAVVSALASSTAYVANAVVLRTIVPEALLLPVLAAAVSTLAGGVGLLLERHEGPYRLGAPAAVAAGVALSVVAVVTGLPSEPSIAVAMAAGWLGVATVAYLSRWAVLEPPEALETARAGTALGVIGSVSGGLRAVGAVVVAFGVAVAVSFASVQLLLPDGTFGVALAATSAAVGAAGLAAIRVGTGPRGTARLSAEGLDTAAAGWSGLAIVVSLPLVVPVLTGIASERFGAELGLGTPTTLGGLVLGATLPFLLASATRNSRGSPRLDVARRWGAALSPAVLAALVAVALGPAALVALVLGATLAGIPLGIFWAAAREASASIQAAAPPSSGVAQGLATALDSESGWRVSAAMVATGVAALAVAVVATGATGLLGQ